MTFVACEADIRSDVRSSMHPCPGNWMAMGNAEVYHAKAWNDVILDYFILELN